MKICSQIADCSTSAAKDTLFICNYQIIREENNIKNIIAEILMTNITI